MFPADLNGQSPHWLCTAESGRIILKCTVTSVLNAGATGQKYPHWHHLIGDLPLDPDRKTDKVL